MLCTYKTTSSASLVLKFVLSSTTHISTNSHPFLVGIVSESEERAGYWVGFGEHCGDAMTHKILDHDTQKLFIEVLLDPRSLPLSTIGLHHMEGRFLHLLTLLKIKFPLDHHLDTQKVSHRTRRPLQSSSGPEMKRIHLDPSLCVPLTPVT